MIYPLNVERWRENVRKALTDALAKNSVQHSLINALGLTFSHLEDILLALIYKESSGNPFAMGDKGNSYGLMQLNYGAGTPQSLGFKGDPSALLNPDVNISVGTMYFLSQLERYRDVPKAILAYNAGSYRLNQSGIAINFNYLDTILSYLQVPLDFFDTLLEKKKLEASLPPPSLPSEPISSIEERKNEKILHRLLPYVIGAGGAGIIALIIQNC